MNTTTQMLLRRVLTLLLSCTLIAVSPFLHAQTEDEDEEVYELSPFSVDASADDGWIAGNTLIGTRANMAIKDLPLSVDALTTEFLQDTGAYTLHDAGSFIAGLDTVADDERRNDNGGTAFRGMSLGGRENAASSRNFFLWYPRSDNYNVERIDFNKGSNSLMFGDASPGGIATVYTKQARFSNFGEFTAQVGSYASRRIMLDVNRQINDKVALRFNMVDREENTYLDFGRDYLMGFDLAMTFKVTDTTTFRFEAEDLRYERTRANSLVEVDQRAANGRSFTSSSRNVYTSDGEYYNPRARPDRLLYPPNGSGGFLEPVPVASVDRSNGATGDNLSLARGMVQQVLTRDGDPFLEFGPVGRPVNTTGPRDFIERDINNYTVWLEQTVGDMFIEFAANRQEQFQFRNDNNFSQTISIDGNKRAFVDSDLDRKKFGNDVNIVRLTASYPLEIGDFTRQFIVANLTYQDDEAYSFRERVVNKAQAWDPDTNSYDVTHDSEGRDRIRVLGYFDAEDPDQALRNPDQWESLFPENLPYVQGIFEPMWVNYTTANKPYTDKRYNKTASISSSGEFLDGKIKSLFGVRKDEFQLKRYQLPQGSREELVEEFGELAWWGQDVFVGDPDEAPEFYEYVPDLNQSATSISAGLVWEVTNNFNLYANYGESFRWQGTEDFLSRIIGAAGGETREIGFKGTAFDDFITFSAAVFEIERSNVAFRLGSQLNSGEVEALFNDTTIDIGPDGTITYIPAEPGSPGFLETGRGLNQEHRQITASETSDGYDFTITLRRWNGFQARLAFSHLEVESSRDLADYIEQVELAEARERAREPIWQAAWPNDPNYVEGEFPADEENLRDDLDDAQDIIAANSGTGRVEGSRARPYSASWILDYQMPDQFILPGMRILLSGRYADNYLLSTNDGVDWIGGSTHTVDLTFAWKTTIDEYPFDIRLRFRDLHDFENNDFKEFNGFIDQFTGEPTWRRRNIRPMSFTLTGTLKF